MFGTLTSLEILTMLLLQNLVIQTKYDNYNVQEVSTAFSVKLIKLKSCDKIVLIVTVYTQFLSKRLLPIINNVTV